MTDYGPLIAQAVEGLDRNTATAGGILYERARAAQLDGLHAIYPPLSKILIAKERLALEKAIRDVEDDITAASTTKRHEPRSDVAPAHSDSETHKRLSPDAHRITLAEGDASRRVGQWAQRLPRWLTGKREQALVNQADLLDIAAKPGQEGPQSRKKRTPSRSSPSAKGGTLASSSDAEASADAVEYGYYRGYLTLAQDRRGRILH